MFNVMTTTSPPRCTIVDNGNEGSVAFSVAVQGIGVYKLDYRRSGIKIAVRVSAQDDGSARMEISASVTRKKWKHITVKLDAKWSEEPERQSILQ